MAYWRYFDCDYLAWRRWYSNHEIPDGCKFMVSFPSLTALYYLFFLEKYFAMVLTVGIMPDLYNPRMFQLVYSAVYPIYNLQI